MRQWGEGTAQFSGGVLSEVGRQASAADRQVIAAGAAAGVSITVRQLERWRASGLVPKPVRRGLGRGQGSTSAHTEPEIAYIVEFAARIRPGVPPALATLCVFADGIEVPEPEYRHALLTVVAIVDESIAVSTGSSHRDDQVDALSLKAVRGRPSQGRRQRLRTHYRNLPPEQRPTITDEFGDPVALSEVEYVDLVLTTEAAFAIQGDLSDPDAITIALDTVSAEWPVDIDLGPHTAAISEVLPTILANDTMWDGIADAARHAPMRHLRSIRDGMLKHLPRDPNQDDATLLFHALAPVALTVFGLNRARADTGTHLAYDDIDELVWSDETPGQWPFIAEVEWRPRR